VPEDLGVKREMFAKLDAASEKNAVLASSSSGILPSRITAELAGKSRCLVAHPISPPYLIPRSNSCQRLGPIPRSWSARAND
jgi:L-gulonate 3-dehydrogenase